MSLVELTAPNEKATSARAIAVRRVDHDRAADRRAVLELLREHLAAMPEGAQAEARYRWLYLDNPHGRAATSLASDRRSGHPVGLTSLFPRRVLVSGHLRKGAIGGDGFVRPDFRRRGIARALHQAAIQRMGHHDIEFMYGPPEPNNLKALLGAGSVVVGAVQRYVRALSPASLASILNPHGRVAAFLSRLALPARSSLRVEALDGRPDHRVNAVFEATVAAGGPAVVPVLDAEFCVWRFGRCPSGAQRARCYCWTARCRSASQPSKTTRGAPPSSTSFAPRRASPTSCGGCSASVTTVTSSSSSCTCRTGPRSTRSSDSASSRAGESRFKFRCPPTTPIGVHSFETTSGRTSGATETPDSVLL